MRTAASQDMLPGDHGLASDSGVAAITRIETGLATTNSANDVFTCTPVHN
jgi:hypothetical protein